MVKFKAALSLLPTFLAQTNSDYGLGLVVPDVLPNVAQYNKTRTRNQIPASYDPRVNFGDPNDQITCSETISRVTSQGGCGSCWAFAAAYILTDSLCVASGVNGVHVAQQHLGSCSSSGDMCGGGWPASATGWVQNNADGTVKKKKEKIEISFFFQKYNFFNSFS